jgi:hypothetical protein
MQKLTRAIVVLGLVVFGLAQLSAQRPPSDTARVRVDQPEGVSIVTGANGDITVIPLTHGSVELVEGSHVVLIAPARSLQDPPYEAAAPPPPPVVRPPGAAARTLYAPQDTDADSRHRYSRGSFRSLCDQHRQRPVDGRRRLAAVTSVTCCV